jgi:hypothetical protein
MAEIEISITPEQLVEALGKMSLAERQRFIQLLTNNPDMQEVLDELVNLTQMPVPETDEELFSDPDVVAYVKERIEEGDRLRAQGVKFKTLDELKAEFEAEGIYKQAKRRLG